MNDDLDQLLIDDGARWRASLPEGPDPAALLADRPVRGASHLRWLAVASAAAVVVVVAVAAVTLRTPSQADRSTGGSAPTTQQGPPAGVRVASYGQASLLVPAGLATRTSTCGEPAANEVVALVGSYGLCPVATDRLATHPGTVIWLSYGQQGSPYANIPTSPADIDGHPVQRGYATNGVGLGVGVSGVVRLAQQGITIGVTAPTRHDVDSLLTTIRIAQVDPLGCAATLSAATKAAPGPSKVLIPTAPTAAVSCQYGIDTASHLLVSSDLLDPAKTARLTTALNALVPDPCHCTHGGTPSPGYDEILYLRYHDGNVLRVDGTIGANLDTYSNRTRTVANYSSSIAELLAKLTNHI